MGGFGIKPPELAKHKGGKESLSDESERHQWAHFEGYSFLKTWQTWKPGCIYPL
jgi:hypothetical protein